MSMQELCRTDIVSVRHWGLLRCGALARLLNVRLFPITGHDEEAEQRDADLVAVLPTECDGIERGIEPRLARLHRHRGDANRAARNDVTLPCGSIGVPSKYYPGLRWCGSPSTIDSAQHEIVVA